MFVIRLEREYGGQEPVTVWLKTANPVRFSDRGNAMKFETKGEAARVAAEAKLVGWVLEDA